MEQQKMERGLKPRHVEMIALGGTIGVGLFMGSANTIQMAGPSVLLCYAVTGVVMFFIMRIMGEMLYQEPVTGSFATYGHKYISPFVGYLTACSYWFLWVVVGLSEITAVGIYVHYWFPLLPQWISALAGMAIGGIYGGWACDRFGRVQTVVWTIVLFSVGTAALGLTHNYWQFAIARFVASLGLGALYVACNTLMAEYVPTRYRTTVLGTLQAGWSVGYIVATLLASWILPEYGWRYLFFIAIIPVVLAVLMKPLVPEPAAWVQAKAERDAARRATDTAGQVSDERVIGIDGDVEFGQLALQT